MQATTSKAPAGGLISTTNGQFYTGGQFMPNTGAFCGKSGQKRKAKWESFSAKSLAFDLGGPKMMQVCEYVSPGVWSVLCVVLCNSEKEAKEYVKTYLARTGSLMAKAV